jgi:hypothetical protein
MSDERLSLLNVFEVEIDGTTRHLLCFMDPVRAGAEGLDTRAVLGEVTPDDRGGFDVGTLELNPDFIETVEMFMNEQGSRSPELIREASTCPGDWLYVLDPRYNADLDLAIDEEPPAVEILGCYAVDETGQIVPGSFQYNRNHLWFNPDSGASSLLNDGAFYDWLHAR